MDSRSIGIAGLWAIAALVAACGNSESPSTAVPLPAPMQPFSALRQPDPTAVIADLSTGTNPYHEVFRRPLWTRHPSTVIPGFPADAPALPLSFGDDLEANLEKDRELWLALQPGVVYWIPGTNLLYARTRYFSDVTPELPGQPTSGQSPYELANHGTLTAGVIAAACPQCYLLIVSDPEGGSAYSLDYAAGHAAWIDVATSTQQLVLSTDVDYVPGIFQQLLGEYAAAARRWTDLGRIFFNASGNNPVTDSINLTPDFTLVGGAYAACRGAELQAGRPAEFVAEYVAEAPASNSTTGFETHSGTSFSAPLAASHFAQALRQVRGVLGDRRSAGTYWAGPAQSSAPLADGVLDRAELYDSFAQVAELFTAAEFSGPCGNAGIPVSAMPWLDLGWGYVGSDQAAAAAALILGNQTAPAKPAAQAQFMQAWLALRAALGPVATAPDADR